MLLSDLCNRTLDTSTLRTNRLSVRDPNGPFGRPSAPLARTGVIAGAEQDIA